MIGLITAGGDLTGKEVFLEEFNKSEISIAADSGIRFFYEYEKIPSVVLGDFDSISEKGKDYIRKHKIEMFTYPTEKDSTDLEIGIHYLVDRGCKDIRILGALGDRIDHSLGNLLLMVRFFEEGIRIVLKNDLMKIQIIDGRIEIRKNYKFVSVLPISSDKVTISMKGFYYPLDHRKMSRGSTLGISNYLIEEIGEIEVSNGKVFLIETNE